MKNIAIALCAAVLAGAGGLAIAKAGDSKVASPNSTQMQPGGLRGGGPDLASLADDLGVSESKLQEAMRSARPDRGSGGAPTDFAATLADALGLSTGTVQKALEANRPDGGMPPGGAPPAGMAPRAGDDSAAAGTTTSDS